MILNVKCLCNYQLVLILSVFFLHSQTTAVESYFEIHSYKGVTSDRTLSKLNSPRIGQEDLSKLLQKVLPGHRKECKALFENYKLLFDKWIFLLS